jgi:hypothetical protein
MSVPVQALTDRIERALKVSVDGRWLPTLVAMADGLFMQAVSVERHVKIVAPILDQDPHRAVKLVPDVLDALVEKNILEQHSIEDLYRASRLDELSHPRVWELNAWWEAYYGIIPAKSEWDDEDDLDIWEEGPLGLAVGKTTLPIGVLVEREEVRNLLEKKVLTQYEPLFRLRLSWHR